MKKSLHVKAICLGISILNILLLTGCPGSNNSPPTGGKSTPPPPVAVLLSEEPDNNATFTLLTFDSAQKEGSYVWKLPEKKFVERGTIRFDLSNQSQPQYYISDAVFSLNNGPETPSPAIGGQNMSGKKIKLTFLDSTPAVECTFDFSDVLQ